MSTTTTNLNLVKPEGTEYVDVDVINDNMDIIDAFAGTVSQKPSINGVELSGNKTSAQLLLADADHTHVMDDITDLPTIPSKTSDLTNDSNFVSDSNYVHTDANFTSEEKTKLSGVAYNANNYTLPVANTTTLGGIKPDGTTLSVDVNGVASVIGGGGGGGTTVVANPAGEATDVLETIQIGTTVYEAGGSGTEELTLAQYNALTPEQKMLDIHYVITDVNGNTDDYSSIQPIISDAYSSSSTYAVGDYVIRSNRLYKCNTAITEPENWDATKWTETKIVDELGNHIIIDENGTSMAARSGLQFVGGVNVSDDSINNKTIVDLASAGGIDGVFINTENVIVPVTRISSSGLSYTATEDCLVYVYLWGGNNTKIKINDVEVGANFSSDKDVYLIPLKKGQTLTTTSGNDYNTYTVYGIQTGTTHSKFQPVIYSEEEREIGVWTDGKPLYQKTVYIDKTEIIGGSFVSLPHGIENIDMVINAEAFAGQGLNSEFPYFMPNRLYGSESTTIQQNIIFVYEGCNTTNLRFTIGSTWTTEPYAIQYIYATIKYTKTTDTPGSGTWTPQGVPTHHYSTDEQIIGTWVDGSTLYEKTFDLGSNVDISNAQWTSSGITILNLNKIIEAKSTNSAGTFYPLMAYHTNGAVNLLACRDSQPASSRWLILQYTKTTD